MTHPKEVVIEPHKGKWLFGLSDVIAHRDLLFFFAWRDVQVRYKQTLLGALWALLQPTLTMLIFTFTFGRLSLLSQGETHYSIFVLCGLVPWQLFSYVLNQASTRIVNDAHIVRKAFFPRIIVPFSTVLAGLIDFLIAFLVLLVGLALSGALPSMRIFMLIPAVLLTLITALGAGLWLAALNVQYRDVRFAVPFLVQTWFFATPIVFPAKLIPDHWTWLASLNPMYTVVELFRWALTSYSPELTYDFISVTVASALFISGVIYFRRLEDSFADII